MFLSEFSLFFVYRHTTYLSISKWHFIFFSPAQSSFTPESCRLLLLMFSSFRLVSDPRTVARAEQLLSVKPQSFSLQEKYDYRIITFNAFANITSILSLKLKYSYL